MILHILLLLGSIELLNVLYLLQAMTGLNHLDLSGNMKIYPDLTQFAAF